MKILLFGGNGTLGKELVKLNNEIICPPRQIVDIADDIVVREYISSLKPEIVINAAALIDNRHVEKFPSDAIRTNIVGSANVATACAELGIRYVYISTDYVYKGDRGNYKETDEVLPFNMYSWTKLGGECSAICVKNHLIIRTSFGKSTFDYPEAFVDKWASKDYVDKLAGKIYEASLSPLTGVLNLGTERKTLYDYAKERNSDVKPIKIESSAFFTPADTSLNLQKWIDYKGAKPDAKPHDSCRICESKRLTKYLDLGLMPLANNLEFTSPRAKTKERFPLQVMFCEDCGLSQLSNVINPEKMFSYYTYRSSVNGGYVKHCRKMAKELKLKWSLDENSFIVDIAGNDGALLKEFKSEIGCKVLNVDPASNLTAIAEAAGIESISKFWSQELALDIQLGHGAADIITATNVFAHVDDVRGFLEASKSLLKSTGVMVIECPYLVDFIENYEFDTVYFEHLSYIGVIPMLKLAEIVGMKLISVEKQNIHGGTIRMTLARKNAEIEVEDSVQQFHERELHLQYDHIAKYRMWTKSVNSIISEFSQRILELKKGGAKIAAFAASAKGNTLLNSAGMNTDILKYIADETPEKIGKFSPGTGIPIVNKQEIINDPPDYIVILSWNFKEEIIEKLRKIYSGSFIVPIPRFEII